MRTLPLVLALFGFSIVASAGPILNGDFESGDISGSGATNWSDSDSVFVFSWCNFPDCTNASGTVGPNSGNGWIWFGASTSGQTASLSQSGITLNPGDMLQFFLWMGESTDSTSALTLSVDSTQIFSVTTADAAAYPSYTLVSLALGALADGSDHTLTFNYSDAGGGVNTNWSLDDVSIVAGVPEPTSAALIGLGLLGLGFAARKRRS